MNFTIKCKSEVGTFWWDGDSWSSNPKVYTEIATAIKVYKERVKALAENYDLFLVRHAQYETK